VSLKGRWGNLRSAMPEGTDPATPHPTAGQEPPQAAEQLPEATPRPQTEPDPQALDPQRLLRIAGVTREVLEEARRIRPEAGAVDHLRQVHDRIYGELKEALPPELYEELDDLTPGIRDGTLEELSLAHAEILGWLEGLFQGTQLAMQLQAAHAFQQQMRRGLPDPAGGRPPEPGGRAEDSRYL
jgi:hypothetical protein